MNCRSITRGAFALYAALLLQLPVTAHAEFPGWLRKRNGAVEDGNALLQRGDAKAALAEYDKAARALPHDPGVQLDRGLALLKMGELPKAREAFLAATAANAPKDVRADAYRNLALAYYRDGDALAAQKKHAEAHKMFQEAVDSAKRSLRLRPEDPSAAWDMELALRRLREEREKQKQEQDKQQQEQQDQPQQDQPQNQDPNQPDQDQQPTDPQSQGDQPKPSDGPKKPEPSDKPQQAQTPPQAAPKPDKQAQKQPQKQPEPEQAASDGSEQRKPVPADVSQALDSLENGEQNFERVRARQRADRENRAPAKDW
jgi:Ca-activated chloride channel homolog